MKKLSAPVLLILVVISLFSCLDGPKSREPYTLKKVVSTETLNPDVSREMHKVEIREVLPANKYIYAYVEEGDHSFWIATGLKDIKKGEVYFYNESVLKTPFESKEHNKVFDTLYLVTSLTPEKHGTEMHNFNTATLGDVEFENIEKKIRREQDSTAIFAGSVTVKELVENPKKYQDKKVELSGRCTKVNLEIMGKNWIHLKDGSADDFDLVITSTEVVKQGDDITIRGIVRLDIDFGSGYSYPILIENGAIAQ
ncbi:MAG: hypothetical protein KJO16_05885 [Muriicola sp.]|nr:hypothetical protein [Muriicola sp.]